MTCPNSGTWTVPSIADFKTFFARDFNYAPTDDPTNLDYVLDDDITRAINEAIINFNPGLGFNPAIVPPATISETTNVFLYLVAFCLIVNIQNSSKGLSSQSKFPISSNGVGGVNVAYAIPERYTKDPILSIYTQNGYGMRYLSMVLPYITGRVTTQIGTTTWT